MNIESLHVYPIKGVRRVTVKYAAVEWRGLRHDRRWMVVDAHGKAVTQRERSELALIRARVDQEGLALEAGGMPALRIAVPSEDVPARQVTIWGATVRARMVDAEVDNWLSAFLQMPCHLVYMPGDSERYVDPAFGTGLVSFADGYPLLITSLESLEDLNTRLEEPVSMTRFRPNVVAVGGKPYEEDCWRRIKIGEVYFKAAKPCSRCTVTTVDQETAHRGKEPLKTMDRFRKHGSKVYFGQNLIPENLGILRTGDPVEVLESALPNEVWKFAV